MLQVSIGYANYQCSCLRYISSSNKTPLIVGLVVGLVGAFLLALIVVIIVYLFKRRKQQRPPATGGAHAEYDQHLPPGADTKGYSSEFTLAGAEGYSTQLPCSGNSNCTSEFFNRTASLVL